MSNISNPIKPPYFRPNNIKNPSCKEGEVGDSGGCGWGERVAKRLLLRQKLQCIV